jgi:uncharacterized protein
MKSRINNSFKILILLSLIVYAAACAYMGINQRSFLYSPQPMAENVKQDTNIEHISFERDGVKLQGYKIHRKIISDINQEQDKAILFYGGNASAIGQYVDFFKQFSQYTVYMVPYRGYGHSQGSPNEAALYSDALYIYDQVSANHQSISAVGRSLGSGVATYVAANREIDKLVLITPYDSITEVAKEKYWMLPVDLLMQDRFDSYARAHKINAQTLVIIAETDQVIKRARTERLLSVLKGDHVHSIVLKGIGHSKIFNQPILLDEMNIFME